MIKIAIIVAVLILGFQYFQKNYILEATWDGEPFFNTEQGIISQANTSSLKSQASDGFDEFR